MEALIVPWCELILTGRSASYDTQYVDSTFLVPGQCLVFYRITWTNSFNSSDSACFWFLTDGFAQFKYFAIG